MKEYIKTIGIALVSIVIVIGGIALFGSKALAPQEIAIRSVTADEHILGSADAPVVIVEYSDLECQFCKTFHETMKRIREEYGENLAWVYRHFPLVRIHENALLLAEASECVAELSGNQAFWDFIDGIFKSTPGNERFDIALLPDIAESVGVTEESLNACLDDNRHAASVKADSDEAIEAGGSGTPYSLILANGRIITVEGAQSFESLKAFIDSASTED